MLFRGCSEVFSTTKIKPDQQIFDMDDNNFDEIIENYASKEKSICNGNVKEQGDNAIMSNNEVVSSNIDTVKNVTVNGSEKEINTNAEQCGNKINKDNHTITKVDIDITTDYNDIAENVANNDDESSREEEDTAKNVKINKVIDHDNDNKTTVANNTKYEENGTEKEINTNAEQCENKHDTENHTSDIDIAKDCKDFTENNDGDNDDSKTLKRYRLRLRQQQSKRYREEPPKKKKIINKGVVKDKNKKVQSKVDLTCHKCYVSFETKTGFSNHMVRHNQPELFTCAQCSMEFLTNKELKDHKNVHVGEDCVFTCEQCEVAYSSHMEYLIHKAEHKQKKFNCEECGKVCMKTQMLAYKDHLFSHFNDTYKCDVCQKHFKNRLCYLRHVESHDANSKKSSYLCGECGKDCKDKKYYDYHMSTHTGVKVYQCLYCGKGFGNITQRVVHTRVHTNERPFKCTKCNESFKQTSNLQRHIQAKHNSEKYSCKYCKKVYKQKRILEQHMRIHTKKNLVSCPVCNEKFAERASMRVHYVYRHTDEKPFKCDVCIKTFKTVGDLRKHVASRLHKNKAYGVEFKRKQLEETN